MYHGIEFILAKIQLFKVYSFDIVTNSLSKRLQFPATQPQQSLNEHGGCRVHVPFWIGDWFCKRRAWPSHSLRFHTNVHFALWLWGEGTWLAILNSTWPLVGNRTTRQRDVSGPWWTPIGRLLLCRLFSILFVVEFSQILKCIGTHFTWLCTCSAILIGSALKWWRVDKSPQVKMNE